jgi:hypothetical protein
MNLTKEKLIKIAIIFGSSLLLLIILGAFLADLAAKAV